MNDKDQSGASKQKRQLKKLIDRAMPNEINSKHENDSNTKFREGYSLIDHRHGLIRDKKTLFALESKSFQVASRAVEAEANRRTSRLKFQPTLQSNLATKENSALSPSSEKAKKHPFVYENMNAFAIKVMEKKLALKYVENLNEEKMNQNIEFNKILEKKLKERRIMIRDKKNNQSKVFKAMLTDAAMKHFQKNSDDNEGNSKRDSIIISKTARGRSSVSSKSPAKNNIYLDNSQIKKISDHVKVEIGLDKLKKQLLDDYDYLAHNHRNEYGSQIENASSLSKEYSRMIINEISPISKQAVAIKTKDQNAPLPYPEESEFSKKASEINQFLMEKTVLSMNNVGRHPANESLNLDLKLAKKCPIHSSHEVRKLFELGVKHADDTDLLTSITAFKQVVILDAELFEAIYNLGCLYEYIKDFELAFKWFYLAKNLQPENKEVNFALALCYFKLMRYEESIEILEKYCTGGAEVSESLSQGPASSSLEVSNQAVQLYMLAICYKGGGKLDKAEVTYNKFLEHIEDSSNREVALFLFALLNKKKSGFSVRKFEEIKMGLLRSFKCIFPEEVDSVSRYWDHGRSAWTETRAEDLIDILLTLGFFKRFPRYILVGFDLNLER
jgi:tetratricopeptide (TPR) repeat protein